MTLAGFLAGKFAGMQPFALSATLTFEQTYSEVEGDSAAVAELAAVLSKPGRPACPAVSGRHRFREPAGRNPAHRRRERKIEGFLNRASGGASQASRCDHSARNIKHLALNREVVAAVEDGRFAVYGVDTADQALSC